MGKKRKKRRTVAPSHSSGSPQNTKSPLYYWDGVELPIELQEEYKKVLELLKEGQYQALNLEKLHAPSNDGRDYWSIRFNRKGRLIFTTEFIEGKRILVFVRALPQHEYDKWKRSPSAAPKLPSIPEQLEVQSSSTEEAQFAQMLQAVDLTQVRALKSYQGKLILLSPTQNEIVEIDGPCIVNGVAGSGKTSSLLFLLLEWKKKNPHGKVRCISSSEILSKSLEEEFNATQAEKGKQGEDEKGKEEKDESVQFRTYVEWLYSDGGYEEELKSREIILRDFEEWFKEYSKGYKEKYRNQEKAKNGFKKKSHSSSSSASLSFFTSVDTPEARFLAMDPAQLYQEFRKISNEEDYVNKGIGSFIAQGEEQRALRAVIYAAYKAFPEAIKEKSEDFASLQQKGESESEPTLVLIDEAQDLSKKQIENIIQWASARGLRVVFFRDSLQSVRDASSNYPIIKNCFFEAQKKPSLSNHKIKEMSLPTSYRSFPAAKPWIDAWLKIRAKLIEKMDKTEMTQLEIKVNEHSAPGSVHWLTDISAEKQALLDAGCANPGFAVVAPKEYVEEARRRFNTQLVFTPEEIKGRQFKVVLVYRPFSPSVFKVAHRIFWENEGESFDRKHSENSDLITSCNEVFVSLTRADSQMIIYQPKEHGTEFLVNSLIEDKIIDPNESFSLALERMDATEEKWLQEAKKQLRYGYIEKSEEIIAYHIKKEELKKEFAEFKMSYIEAKKEPSCTVPQQENLKREKPKGKEKGNGKEKEKEKEEARSTQLCSSQHKSNLSPKKPSQKEAADSLYAQIKEKDGNSLPGLIYLAQEGNIYAQYHLHSFYSKDPSVPEEYRGDASYWFHLAAKGGHPKAQYLMAKELFFEAKRLRTLQEKTEDENAISRYEKQAFGMCLVAAESNNPKAQHLLCMMYGEGKGVELNMEKCFFWCAESAKQGFSSAVYDLARLYYEGAGTVKDLKKAELWCREAIRKGHQKAIVLLQDIEREKTETEIFSSITQPILSLAENSRFLNSHVSAPVSSPSSASSNVSHFKKKPEYSKEPHLALRQAAAHGDIAKIKDLVENPFLNINQQGPASGKTALHQAVLNERKEVVELLLERNADPLLSDKEGKSALDLAKQKGYSEICGLLEQAQYKLFKVLTH